MGESIAAAVVLALGGWIWAFGRSHWDRRTVYRWMQTTTLDKPGRSHVPAVAMAKGTHLSEDRVRAACLKDPRILRHGTDGAEIWSVWREEPQREYQMFVLGGGQRVAR